MKVLNASKQYLIRKMLFKSYIWLFLPIAVFGGLKSCALYKESQGHLTKSRISVSGYTRKDGTPVSGYNRRPSGGIKYDRPLKNEQFFLGTIFFICFIVITVYPISTFSVIKFRIQSRERRLEQLLWQKARVLKKTKGLKLRKD